MPDNTDRNLGDAIQAIGKQIADQLAESERRAKAAEARIEDLQKRIADERAARRDRTRDLDRMEKDLATQLAKLDRDQSAVGAELARLQQENDALRQREDLWRQQVRRLSDDHHASTELFEHAHRELQIRGRAYRDLRDETKATTDTLRHTVADQQAALDAQGAQLGRLSDQLDALQKELSETRAESDTLRRQEGRMARLLDEALSAARTERSRAEALSSACAARDEQIRSLEQVLAAETQALRDIGEAVPADGASPATAEGRNGAADLRRVLGEHLQRIEATRAAMGDAEQRYQSRLGVIADLRTARTSLSQSVRQLQDELRDGLQAGAKAATAPDSAPAAPGWYVRDGEGGDYGPASLDELRVWAAECRVAAYHEVSPDRLQWRRADTVEALGMVWTVPQLSGAVFGPVSADAVAYLVRNGIVGADAIAENRLTRERLPAASAPFTNNGLVTGSS